MKLMIFKQLLFINNRIYTPIAGGYIVALDGFSGKLIWKSAKFGDFVAKRGQFIINLMMVFLD